jgi:NAD(P)-dependent dehydrogenase (short-subunit alcohol dehydrogenase family)
MKSQRSVLILKGGSRQNRFGEPKEIADLIVFAVSPPARWMTGAVLRMDGGEVKLH